MHTKMGSSDLPLPLFLLSLFFHSFSAASTEFLVGDRHGWAVPNPPTEAAMYNKWASHNRFNVNDTLHFKYEKDSVMEVTEEEYKQCISSKPVFFGSNGDTAVRLERAGLFYFISGVSGHCQKGQRMIIKVLEPLSPPQPPAAQPHHNNNAVSVSSVSSLMFGMFFMFLALVLSF